MLLLIRQMHSVRHHIPIFFSHLQKEMSVNSTFHDIFFMKVKRFKVFLNLPLSAAGTQRRQWTCFWTVFSSIFLLALVEIKNSDILL